MANTQTNSSLTVRMRVLIGTAFGASLLLLIANSALWFNNYIFNTTNFTNVTTEALLSDSSRTALATAVVDKALQNRPVAQRAIQEPATKLVAGLLDSNVAETVVERSISRLHTIITSKDPQSIEINLVPIKDTITKVLDLAEQTTGKTVDEDRFNPEDLPDTITLVDATKLPNIYVMGTVLLWLGPISLLAALGLLVYPIYRQRQNLKALHVVLAVQAGFVGIFWITALMIGPLFKPPILAQVSDTNVRTVVENVYNAFITTFNNQSSILLAIALILLVAAGASWYYQDVYKVKRS
ncbi:hypothetical protein EPO04_03535 [Patescibacteria group bacterium]|nr:MAG: hypothetical protein EPO04_03535 [Patescibacteria group bacterium]